MGDEASEEPEPLEEWPLEKVEVAGEDGVIEDGVERVFTTRGSKRCRAGCSMSSRTVAIGYYS
jgi:hypothetical protein